MFNRLKAFRAYQQVKKSETAWVSKISTESVFYYKGGLSGRFIEIEEDGIIKYGTYDGACPGIADAQFTFQGLVMRNTQELALREVEKIIGEKFDVQNTAKHQFNQKFFFGPQQDYRGQRL